MTISLPASAIATNASDEQGVWVTVQSPPRVRTDQWGYLAPTRLSLQRFLSSSHVSHVVAVLCLLDNSGVIGVDLAPGMVDVDQDTNPVERWLADDLPEQAPGFPRVGLGTTPLPVVLQMVDPVSDPSAGWQWLTTHRWSDFVVATWKSDELFGRGGFTPEEGLVNDFPEFTFWHRIDSLALKLPNPSDSRRRQRSDIRMSASVADQRAHALAYLRAARLEYLDGDGYDPLLHGPADTRRCARNVASSVQDMSDLSDHLLGVTMGEPFMTLDRALMYTAARIGGPEARRIEFETTPGVEREEALATLVALNRPTGR